jgi:hypothetical protein
VKRWLFCKVLHFHGPVEIEPDDEGFLQKRCIWCQQLV